MTEEAAPKKNLNLMTPELVCKLLNKLLSARFWMAMIVTLGGTGLTAAVCILLWAENKELVTFVVGQFFMIWKDIAKDYFQREREVSAK